jgi:hypothetical protein
MRALLSRSQTEAGIYKNAIPPNEVAAKSHSAGRDIRSGDECFFFITLLSSVQ